MSTTRFKMAWNERLRNLTPRATILAGILLLFVAAVVDWVIEPQIGTSVVYLLPIALVTWRASRWAGQGMALACGFTWLVIELLTDKSYTSVLIPCWNAIMRTTFFCLVSGLLAEVLERKRVEQSLRESERRIAEASDREQRRIGEDLHDGLCQQLVGAAFAARKLAARLSDLSLPETKDAGEIAELLGQSIAQARDAARGLYLVELEADGLISALEELAAQTQSRHGITCQFSNNLSAPISEETVVTTLFRIAQEAVNNAVKHAEASLVAIRLAADGEEIRLEIEDNGKGLPQGYEDRGGIGLQIMNYRAQMIGGALDVGPGSRGGVRVTCTLSGRKSVSANKNEVLK